MTLQTLYPLFRKELRESLTGLILGVIAVGCAVGFHFQFSNSLGGLLGTVSFVAAVLCIIFLALIRIAAERNEGTWEFLCTQPVRVRHVIAMKWIVTMGLTSAITAALCAVSWMTFATNGLVTDIGFFRWILFQVSTVGALVSLLVLIDTVDWDRWIKIRVFGTSVVLFVFFFLLSDRAGMSWTKTVCLIGVAVASGGLAIMIAPFAARDSVLPRIGFSRNVSRRTLTSTSAYIWLQWRLARGIVYSLTGFIPFILLFHASGAGIDNGSFSFQDAFEVSSAVIPYHVWMSAVILGIALPILDISSKANAFKGSLPLSQVRSYRISAWHAAAMLAITALPGFLMTAAGQMRLPDSGAPMLSTWLPNFLLAAALLMLLHLLTSLQISVGNPVVSVFAYAAPFLSTATAAAAIFAYSRVGQVSLPTAAACLLPAIVLSFFAAPHLGRLREL